MQSCTVGFHSPIGAPIDRSHLLRRPVFRVSKILGKITFGLSLKMSGKDGPPAKKSNGKYMLKNVN